MKKLNKAELLDFSIEVVDTCIENEKHDNSDVQSGCWGDTGSGAYC